MVRTFHLSPVSITNQAEQWYDASPPILSYTIWFSQRTGSTLLCDALESTGLAGHPGEHLEGTVEQLYTRHSARSPAELRSRIWKAASTSNGVLGLKHGMSEHSFSAVLEAFREIDGHDGTRPHLGECLSAAVGTEDARLPREDFGTSFWQLATVGYAGSGCVERAVMSLIGP
jgi:Stf0 sulphotransferase